MTPHQPKRTRIYHQPKVGIVVLNFNGFTKLGRLFEFCLHSLLATNYNNLKICFTDNGSTDNSVEYVRSLRDSRVLIVELKENFGWSGGNNRGAKHCKDCEYLVFINNDVAITDANWLIKLINLMELNPKIGVAQPLIHNADGSVCAGFSLGRLGFSKMRTSYEDDKPLFYVSGAAMVTRTNLFFKLGGFDESLFLFHDDVDYAWRVLLAGYSGAIAKSSRVYHFVGKSVGSNPYAHALRMYYVIRNNIWVMFRNYTWSSFLIFLPLTMIASITSFFLRALRDKETLRLKSIISGLIDGILHMNRTPTGKVIRKCKETEVLKMMDVKTDIDLLAPWVRWLFKIEF
jgi:hypothetical protein